MIEVIRAEQKHVQAVARLFDLYRQFYECPADIELAEKFIAERINNAESVIFMACDDEQAIGFVQLYPSFCSVEAIKIFILYDLFVEKDYRGSGAAQLLMQRAKAYAKEHLAKRIDLETAVDNIVGQKLYKKMGYERANEGFYTYSLVLD